MRVESISSTEKIIKSHGVGAHPMEGQPKNFKTLDIESSQPSTIGEQELIEAIEKANQTLKGANTSFEFSIHEQTRAIMVKIKNNDTNEVIREIPPEKILDMVAKMWEMAGILVDERV